MVFADHSEPVVLRVATGERIAVARFEHPPEQVRFDPSGHRLIWFGPLVARVTDADTGRTLADLHGPGAEVAEVRFDRAGDRVATWATDRSATLWNADTGAALVSVNGVAMDALAVTGDGLRLATGGDDGSIRIWDAATGRLLEVLHGDGPAAGELRWSADGTRLIAESARTRSVSIWDVHLEQRSPREISELMPPSLAAGLVEQLLAPRP
jgi:WD40 repeat protein